MFQHYEESHKGESNPTFKFRVVRGFKSALDRQIAEAVRIEMRGSILNRRGEFNRCSLTRLGVDWKWEDERWSKSLETIKAKEDDANFSLVEPQDSKRPGDACRSKGAKKLKLESGDRVWGEQADHLLEHGPFLMSKTVDVAQSKQSKLTVMKGIEWIAYSLVKEMAWEAVSMAFGMNDVANWEEWNEPECDSVGENNNEVVLAKQEPVCGTTQYLGEGGGAGGGKPKGKRNKNKKNKLPGVSASQKSVAELFKLVQAQDQISHAQCQQGGEGVANLNSEMVLRGVQSQNLNMESENTLVPLQPQNWYRKLQIYRAEES